MTGRLGPWLNRAQMRRWLMAVSVIIAGASGLGAAVSAAADTQTTTPTTTSTTPTTPTVTTPAPPAKASLKLSLQDVFTLGKTDVTIPHRTVHVEGIVRPFIRDQHVSMSVYLGQRLVRTYRLKIRYAGNGKYGRVSYPIQVSGAGNVRIVVKHQATPQLASFAAKDSFETLNPQAGFGSRSDFVRLIQQRLVALHLYLPQTGVYDSGTGLAMDAYHRLLRWGTYQTLDQRTVNALLDGQGSFKVHDPGAGRHAEGNLTEQLLALINGSHVYWIFPISSGKPSTPTVLGHFHIYSRVPGYLPDGMYYSSFFFGGYAIHGYNPAPDYPASHGCMRLPIVDAIAAFNWLAMGDVVDVYH
jgi:L,D-transpeptidase-like protein